MADQHPLTDNFIRTQWGYIDTEKNRLTYFPTRKTNKELEDKILNYYVEEDLLSAADLQLEQVKEWLRNNLNFWYLKPTEVGHSCHEIDVDKFDG